VGGWSTATLSLHARLTEGSTFQLGAGSSLVSRDQSDPCSATPINAMTNDRHRNVGLWADRTIGSPSSGGGAALGGGSVSGAAGSQSFDGQLCSGRSGDGLVCEQQLHELWSERVDPQHHSRIGRQHAIRSDIVFVQIEIRPSEWEDPHRRCRGQARSCPSAWRAHEESGAGGVISTLQRTEVFSIRRSQRISRV
jgi:hypothetical protein